MSTVQHTVSNLVVHKLRKEPDRPAAVELRSGGCRIDEAAVRMVERLCKVYGERSSKGYGRFEDDEGEFPMAALVREHVVDRSLEFVPLAERMMPLLQACAEDDSLDASGYVIVARIQEGGTDTLWVAVVGETVGSAMTGALDVVDCTHLDFSALHAAGRIDLTAWQRGDERYISFLRGRGGAAGWFKRFLGCSDVVIALDETKKLVQRLTDFAETAQLAPPERDALLERAHGYLDELGESGAPLALDEIAREVFPEQPERLDAALASGEAPIAGGFVPSRRALRPLVRFSASGEQWKLEFDRNGLRSGAVHYDRDAGTLVLSGLPDYLKRMLQEE